MPLFNPFETIDPSLPNPLQLAIAEFVTWGQSYLDREQVANRIQTPLYHYTDAAGLKGIMDSGTIWYSHYRHLNDPSELFHGVDLTKSLIEELCEPRDGRVRMLFDCISDMLRWENFEGNLDFYIACFSRAFDDLGQWRAYADNGRGMAIGFSPSVFVPQPAPEEGLPAEFLGLVHYSEREIKICQKEALEMVRGIFEKAANENAGLMRDRAIGLKFIQDLARHVVANPLIWNFLTEKHGAYAHEHEVRQIMMGTPDDLRPHVRTRTSRGSIVPYVAMPIDVHEPGCIHEIMVGPAAPSDAEVGIRALLDQFGLSEHVPVRRSTIPYRA